jgi:hypothetical protein
MNTHESNESKTSSGPMSLHTKHVTILSNLIIDQNKQLLQIMAIDLQIPYHELKTRYILSRQKIEAISNKQ